MDYQEILDWWLENYNQDSLQTIGLTITALSFAGVTLWNSIKYLIWLSRWIMSLIKPKSTVTITALSAQYYLKTYEDMETVWDEGVEFVQELPNLLIPKMNWKYQRGNNEYIFLKLDIHNHTNKDIEIDYCYATMLSSPQMLIEAEPAQEFLFNNQRLGKIHVLSNELPIPIIMETMFATPMNLESSKNYYRYFCLKIIDFPDSIDNVEVEIQMMEGRVANKRSYTAKIKFDKHDDCILLRNEINFSEKIKKDILKVHSNRNNIYLC